ncbi:hypothetical protein [Frigoribacterium salinisoli]
MIDWSAFLLVAVVALVAACALVSVYSLGLRLLAAEPRTTLATVGARACFGLCAVGVLAGIWLIVPALHG